ncbi:MAG TPA: glycosyltransferase family 39 protein, partial [Ktedonobacterales bacterium]
MLDAQSRSLVASPAHPDASRLAWLRHPELWVALALGGLLRFIWLDRAMWLSDQNDLLDLARTAVTRGVIPVTGIRASIGALNHPLSAYILLPVAVVTPSPLAQTIALAIWNVLGIALVYLASLRGFGRGVARWATLIFATCTATVQYSHFVWQQNYIAPLLALWLLCLFAGVIRGARGWLASATALGLAAAMLHPTALALLPVLVVAALLSPRLPSRCELAAVAGLGLLGVLPTLVWEVLSHGYDITALRTYLATPGRLDLEVLAMMPRAFGDALGADSLGSGTLAAHWQALGTALGI